MKPAIPLLITLLAACDEGAIDEAVHRGPGATVQTADLVGLYEGQSQGVRRSRMCIISTSPDSGAFGLVVETGNGSCSGAGEARRIGGILRLTMAGDGDCSVEAAIEGTEVTLPGAVGEGCAYYCAPGATLAGAVLEKTGGSGEDARRATDLAGDPLCG